MDDRELNAMNQIVNALENLEDEVIERILKWTAQRYSAKILSPFEKNVADTTKQAELNKDAFPGVADFFDKAKPRMGYEKVLIVAYYLQKIDGKEDLDAQSVNTELKNLGHGVQNITEAFSVLINRKPSLAMQTRKTGSAKQGRKKYKITIEGLRKVERMVTGVQEESISSHSTEV